MLMKVYLILNMKVVQNMIEITSLRHSMQENTTANNFSPMLTPAKINLPQIPLLEFSNAEGEDLLNFFANFEGIVDK